MTALRDHVTAALPDEAALQRALNGFADDVWAQASEELGDLTGFDVVLTPGGTGEAFGRALAEHHGAALAVAHPHGLTVPVIRTAHWAVAQRALSGRRRALIASPLLTNGLTELELAAIARQSGTDVTACVAALEFTSDGGRSRLNVQGIPVQAVVQIARTPAGLQFERRSAT